MVKLNVSLPGEYKMVGPCWCVYKDKGITTKFVSEKANNYISLNSLKRFFKLTGSAVDIQIQLMELLTKTIDQINNKSDTYYI
jgi:hypothetical protein